MECVDQVEARVLRSSAFRNALLIAGGHGLKLHVRNTANVATLHRHLLLPLVAEPGQ
uniref:Uncharacterized protein n=1 Tax=uncultured prokaryote TaxID=198431 RepID=A0A0H5Q174_9ZZZZ|nr:hypothetical protein [uncultured prokaryote]